MSVLNYTLLGQKSGRAFSANENKIKLNHETHTYKNKVSTRKAFYELENFHFENCVTPMIKPY